MVLILLIGFVGQLIWFQNIDGYVKLKISINIVQLCGYPDISVAKIEGYRIRKTVSPKKPLCEPQSSKPIEKYINKSGRIKGGKYCNACYHPIIKNGLWQHYDCKKFLNGTHKLSLPDVQETIEIENW